MGLIIGPIVILLSLPLLFRFIPPNGWYGVRIPAAYKSPDNWYRINRMGAVYLMIYGFVCIAIGLIPGGNVPSLLWFSPLLLMYLPLFSILIHSRKYS